MGSKGGTNTVETQSQPPAAYLNAYTNVTNQANSVAATPYQSYPGQTVAQFSPDQSAAIGQVEGLTANGGVQSPYLAAAQGDITNATQPVLTPGLQQNIAQSSGQALAAPTQQAVSGIQGATAAGTAGITGAAGSLTPGSVAQWESPYTQDVVNATQAEFNNQNAQQQSQVAGNAISSGAFGGDRAAVASALTAQQQQLAQAPVIAGLENTGYTTALGAAQQQAGLQTSAAQAAGTLGLQGATAAGQAGMTGASTASQLGLQGASTTLGANEAQGWLSSQAGAAEANLGSEAQSTGLQGASALLQSGGLEQEMAQENLNVPYEQYLAAQAYPFQTTGWLGGIDEGLGAAAGGTSTTTSPAPSSLSQVAGLGVAGFGLYNAANNAGLFGSAAGSAIGSGLSDAAVSSASYGASGLAGAGDGVASLSGAKRGGGIEHSHDEIGMNARAHRDSGGMVPAGSQPYGNTPPITTGVGSSSSSLAPVPGMSASVVPNAPSHGGGRGIPKAPQAAQQPTFGQSLQQDVGLYNAAQKAGLFSSNASGSAQGGMVPARAMGGVIPTVSVTGNTVSTSPGSITHDLRAPTETTSTMSNAPIQLTEGAQLYNTAASAVAGFYGGPAAGAAVSAAEQEDPSMSPGAIAQETDAPGTGTLLQDIEFGGLKRGGSIPHRDSGGGTGGGTSGNSNVTVTVQPDPSQGAQPAASQPSWYAPMVQENLDNQMATMLAPTVAATDASAMTDPSAGMTAADTSSMAGMRSGGTVHRPHFQAGGFSSSDMPYWAREQENQSVNRHGLLASPIAGRTDKLAVSPAAGSYVIPADVISGLGEGNTLAGANVMQKILETGPHGIQMPQERRGMGPPRPPPAYREGEMDDGMAAGGGIAHLATGGASSGGMSPAVTSYLASNGSGGFGLPSGNGTYSAVPSTGINASTGQGSSATGNAPLDSYLNQTEAGASFAKPAVSTYTPPPPPPTDNTTFDQLWNPPAKRGGRIEHITRHGGGMMPKRASGGDTPSADDDMGLPDYSGHIVAPQFDDDDLPPPSHAAAAPPPVKHEGDPLDAAFKPGSSSASPPASTSSTASSPPPARQPNRMLNPPSDIKVRGGMQPASPPPPAGLSSSPPDSTRGGTSAPPPPTPQMGSSGAHNMMSRDRGSDIDNYLNRFQPPKADPWLSVAQAGFAMAAGRSPHALENIGAGAEKGVTTYIQQQQEASKEKQQAGETAARLADTDAYRSAVIGNRGDNTDIKRAQLGALQSYRQRAQDLIAGGLDERRAHEQAWEEFQNQGLGIRQQNANTSATNSTNRNTLGLASLAQRQEAEDWRQKYQQAQLDAQKQGRSLTLQEQQRWHDVLLSHYNTEEDVSLAGKQNAITGKPMFSDPHATGQHLRDQNAPPQPVAPAAATSSPSVSTLWGN